MIAQHIDYKLKGLEKLNDEEKARFRCRLAELKDEIENKYVGYVKRGLVDQEMAQEACYREILRAVAREFNLVLLGYVPLT